MRVAIHQPNLFPWLGFFDKMAQADLFIFLDNTPFTKGGYQNRVQIKGPQGAQWLTVPVHTKGRLGQLTYAVEIDNKLTWHSTHLKTFQMLYGRAPGFERLYPYLERVYQSSYERLVPFNLAGIELARRELGIATPCLLASELGVSGAGSQLLCDLVAQAGGTIYLSGPSGRNYLDEALFHRRGIAVEYHSFMPFEYPQRYGAFIGGLSVLDYLFNDSGLEAWKRIRR